MKIDNRFTARLLPLLCLPDKNFDLSPMEPSNALKRKAPMLEKQFPCPFPGCGKSFPTRQSTNNHERIHFPDLWFKCDHEGCDYSNAFIAGLTGHKLRNHTEERPHACDECDSKFATPNELKTHSRSHSEARPFPCVVPGCNRAFKDAAKLKRHVLALHFNEKAHICLEKDCEAAFCTPDELKIHLRRHAGSNRFPCSIEGCESSFSDSGDLARHESYHEGLHLHECTVEWCDWAFQELEDLESHIRRVHAEREKTFKCLVEQCGSVFYSTWDLASHQASHSEDRPHRCLVEGCGHSSKTSRELTQHQRTHSEDRPYKCEIEDCGKTFKTNGELATHVKRHVGIRAHKCLVEGCGKEFFDLTKLREHSARLHEEREKSFKCLIEKCKSVFYTAHDLSVHIARHSEDRPYPCLVDGCGRTFKTPGEVASHQRMHCEDRPHICEVEDCGKAYKTGGELVRHHNHAHLGMRVPCIFGGCEESFYDRYSMMMHRFRFHLELSKQATEKPEWIGTKVCVCCTKVGLYSLVAIESQLCAGCREDEGLVCRREKMVQQHLIEKLGESAVCERVRQYQGRRVCLCD